MCKNQVKLTHQSQWAGHWFEVFPNIHKKLSLKKENGAHVNEGSLECVKLEPADPHHASPVHHKMFVSFASNL